MKEIEAILQSKGVMPTPVRKLVYKSLKEAGAPRSLSDLESLLDTVDKSTISRTLATFKEHHLIHSFSDGSNSVKYELCSSSHSMNHDDFHVHFRCEKCGETICLPQVSIPEVELPQGFDVKEVNYVITGTCSKCSKS